MIPGGSPERSSVHLGKKSPDNTIAAISLLIEKLLDIYKTETHSTPFPIEALQYSHRFDLFLKFALKQVENPTPLIQLQDDFLKEYSRICSNLVYRTSFIKAEPSESFKIPRDDKRFLSPIWKENPYFEFLKRIYYLTTKFSLKWLNSIEHLDKKTKQQLHFYLKNFLNLLAPTNNLWENPEVIKATLETGGENLLKGFRNYLEDLVLNEGRLNIRMTDLKAFKVGKNLGITPGKIIYQNDLMQLIQYLPTTKTVYKTPLLFIPPWINKYYILDLSPENSLVKWLVEQGFTVYMISWINPGQKNASKTFEDYMLDGPLQALDIITKNGDSSSVHMVGYCIGGTLLACTLAYMKKRNDSRALSASFFMSLLDFSNPGELGVFIDKAQIDALEKSMRSKGYLNGRLLDIAFNVLRPNDLIWPYFINHYLLGKPTKPFDLLYWNADSSNLSYKMYIFYLRNMYLNNLLRKPDHIQLKGIPLNLSEITTPAFFLASETDHITLWRSIYSGLHLLHNPVDFILAESGHVRGVINPPSLKKYGFRKHERFGKGEAFPKKSQDWLEGATKYAGSWWPYWAEWLQNHNAEKIDPKNLVNFASLEDAPGSYVLKRI